MLYVAETPVQTVSLPLMDAGAYGAPTVTDRLTGGEASPQAFLATTDTAPPTEPAVPALATMDVVLEVPVHPLGNVQM
jgi:hypothetical protein